MKPFITFSGLSKAMIRGIQKESKREKMSTPVIIFTISTPFTDECQHQVFCKQQWLEV